MEKKILLIEDEVRTVQGAFSLANLYGFDGTLDIVIVNCSQDVDFNALSQYDLIFVDITLDQSEMDGLSIIQKILRGTDYPLEQIIVLTGNYNVEDDLRNKGIDSTKVDVIYKPASYKDITQIIKGKADNQGSLNL